MDRAAEVEADLLGTWHEARAALRLSLTEKQVGDALRLLVQLRRAVSTYAAATPTPVATAPTLSTASVAQTAPGTTLGAPTQAAATSAGPGPESRNLAATMPPVGNTLTDPASAATAPEAVTPAGPEASTLAGPAATTPASFCFSNDDLRGWVSLLKKYVERLQGRLRDVPDFSEPPEEVVLLAIIVVTAIRTVKKFFGHKSEQVPWEELEFLLVAFVEASTRFYINKAFAVATPTKLGRYLALFGRALEQLNNDCAVDVAELYKKSCKFKDSEGRAAFVVRLLQDSNADADLKALHRDFEVLRDLHSLNKMNEALGVAVGALQRDDAAEWKRRGRWAVRRALFVVGESMKGSWQSPNLSARSQDVIMALVHDTVLDRFVKIRDELAHPKGQRLVTEREQQLKDDLSNVKRAVDAQLNSVEMAWGKEHCVSEVRARLDLRERFMTLPLARRRLGASIVQAVIAELESIWDEAGTDEDSRRQMRQAVSRFDDTAPLTFELGTNDSRQFQLWTMTPLELLRTLRMALEDAPAHLFMRALLLIRSCLMNTTGLDRAARQLSRSPGSQLPRATSQCFADLRDLREHDRQHPDKESSHFALRDILMASEPKLLEDHQTPVASMAAPLLFGASLRNFLHHEDAFVETCFYPNEELRAQLELLQAESDLSALWSARTRPTGWQKAERDYDRLLEVAKDKDATFAAARAGRLRDVQRAAQRLPLGAQDPQRRSLLHAAAEGGQQEVLRWLLRQTSVRSTSADWQGQTPLHVAASKGVAKLLLSENSEFGHIGFGAGPHFYIPASDSAEDKQAAEDANMINWGFGVTLEPMFHGRYPDQVYSSTRPTFTDAEKALLNNSVDFLAVNMYDGKVVRHGEEPPHFGVGPDTHGKVNLLYLRELLAGMKEYGNNILGYMVWSLIDIFEYDYPTPWGLVEVDYASGSLKRTPKESARLFQEMRRTGLVPVIEASSAAHLRPTLALAAITVLFLL